MESFANMFADAFGPWIVTVVKEGECHVMGAGYTRITGDILCDGEFAGMFVRTVNGDDVEHTKLAMNEKFQQRGFARKWIERCEDRYRANSIHTVSIVADDRGSYVWPRLGFVPYTERELANLLRYVSARVRGGRLDEMQQAAWEKVQADPVANFALLGYLTDTEGRHVLAGSIWQGVKTL